LSIHLDISLLSFFTYTATTEIYTLSLHDALPILDRQDVGRRPDHRRLGRHQRILAGADGAQARGHCRHRQARGRDLRWAGERLRSEEHTSELQSPYDLVCRLLLEKKKQKINKNNN